MSDDLQTLRADIGFLRHLAEEGRAASPGGGAILVAAGAIYGAAAVAHWLVQTGRITGSDWAYPGIWLGATALFLIFLTALKRGKPVGVGTDRAASVAWAGVGWTVAVMSGAIALVSWRAHSAIPLLLFPSLILALYGMAWMIAAAVSRRRWMGATSIGAYSLALLNAWASVGDVAMLVYAASLAALAIIPGLALMRAGRPAAKP